RGYDPADPGSSSRDADELPDALDAGARRLRVAVPRDFWEGSCDPAVAERVEVALARLSALGVEVVDVHLGISVLQVMAIGYVIILAEAAAHHLPNLRARTEGYGREFGLVLR